MNRLMQWFALELMSIAFACSVCGATAVTAAEPGAQLAVKPPLPRPSDEVVIEVRQTTPLDPNYNCIYLAKGIAAVQTISFDRVQTNADGGFTILLGALELGNYTFTLTSHPCQRNGSGSDSTVSFVVSALPIVVEYFNAARGHYFMTPDPRDIDLLDGGVFPGWERTHESFRVLPATTAVAGAASVCRYYGLPSAGLDTHFFSDDPAECAAVLSLWPDKWVLESESAFSVEHDWMDSDYFCEDSHRRLYRLYNNRADVNHRYTVSEAIRDQMMAAGWILEGKHGGSPPYTFAMCVPM